MSDNQIMIFSASVCLSVTAIFHSKEYRRVRLHASNFLFLRPHLHFFNLHSFSAHLPIQNHQTRYINDLPSSFLSVDDHEYIGIGETGEFHRRLHEDRRE